MTITDARVEYHVNPLGIDNLQPRFFWKLKSEKKNIKQTAWRILACSEPEESAIIWDSGKVESDCSQQILWDGPQLHSGQRVYWKILVEAANTEEQISAQSQWNFFEMGLLESSDWKGKWIEPGEQEDYLNFQPAPYLRKAFVVRENLKTARIYQTAHGLYEFWLNGSLGTEDLFKPGFTSYHNRLQYQVYDITDLLHEGENVWAVALGDGWWRGKMGGTTRNNFGYWLQFLGQIVLTYQDGSQEHIVTDESFRYHYGGIRMCDWRDGEIFDWEKEPEGWRTVAFDDSSWKPVTYAKGVSCKKEHLIASRSVPVREKEEFHPQTFTDTADNLILDFGQNIAGRVHMKLRGCKPGQKVTLTHGEALKGGAFSLENLLGGMFEQEHFQQIEYIAKGEAEEVFCPTFSVFGFRYVKLEGYDGPILPGDFVARAIYSALDETGDFSCSNELVNQLVKNSRWSQKGNYLDVPTDCPTRERSPWTGDSQVYCRTAANFMNVYPFFEKWMQDYICDQMKSGKLKSTIPCGGQNAEENERAKRAFFERTKDQKELSVTDQMIMMMYMDESEDSSVADGSAGWSDAAVINPYTMYLCYADPQILQNQYACAKKHVEYMFNKAKNINPNREAQPEYHTWTDGELDADYIWDTEFHWGEWLEADIGTEGEMKVMIQKFMNPDPEVPTAFMCYSTRLLSEIAEVLGLEEDAQYYRQKSDKVKKMFNKYIIQENGQIKPGRQAPNVRALAFDLCDEAHREKVTMDLVNTIEACDYHLNTGFLATPYLLDVLVDSGHPDVAFRLLEQETAPSWLYNVKKGATTILEEWNGMETHVGSFNHYSYGAVCNFLFTTVAGIRPLFRDPGYKTFVIEPVIGGSLTHAKAVYESLYGTIRSEWTRTNEEIAYLFEVPANTTAIVRIAAQEHMLDDIRRNYPDAVYCAGKISFAVGSGIWTLRTYNTFIANS